MEFSDINRAEGTEDDIRTEFGDDRYASSSSGRPVEIVSGLEGSGVFRSHLENGTDYRVVRPLPETVSTSPTTLWTSQTAPNIVLKVGVFKFALSVC